MHALALIVLLLEPGVASSQGPWIEVGLPVVSSPLTILSYRDTLHLCLVSPQGDVLYTSNGGESWLQDSVPSTYDIVKTELVSDSTIWALASAIDHYANHTRRSEMFRSTNGGKTWTLSGPPDSVTVIAADFTGDNLAWCASPTHLWATSDGGLTWRERGPLHTYSSSYDEQYHNLEFLDSEAGYLGGGGTHFWSVDFQRTLDGGSTWQRYEGLPTNLPYMYAEPIHFTDDSICTFSYGYYDEHVNHHFGGLAMSWNRLNDWVIVGPTWYPYDGPPYLDGFALSRNDFWLLKFEDGAIRRTRDGGATWRVDSLAVRITQIAGDRQGLRFALGGNRLFRSSEILLDVSSPTRKPDGMALEQNFPNPFNPSTTIRYRIDVQSPVVLDVFDVLGRRITTLQDGVMEPGIHEVTLDGKGMSSGVYFYKIRVGSRSETKRLLLLR